MTQKIQHWLDGVIYKNKPTIFPRLDSCEHPTVLIFSGGFYKYKGNKMVGYNYRAHWGAKKTPLYVAVLDFFANHPDYKITADEFASLVSMLSSMVLEKA